MLVLPRLRQPINPARIDRNNPYARDLKIAVSGAHPRLNAAQGMGVVVPNGVGTRVGRGGVGLAWGATSNAGVKVNSTTALTNGFSGSTLGISILVLADPAASTTRYVPFGSVEAAQPEFNLGFNTNKSNVAASGGFSVATQGANGANATGVVDGGLHAFVCTFATAASAPKLFVDGIEVTASSTANAQLNDSGCADYVGGYVSSGFAVTGFGQYLTLAWNRELSQAEIVDLSRNPWAVFEREVLYVGSAASGFTGTLATTNANDTLAASGTAVGFTGTLASTNANDTLAGAGTQTNTGTLATTNAHDALAGVGYLAATGALDYTNANDTIIARGETGGDFSGGYLRASDRRRTQAEINDARRRFGINVPQEVIEVIQEAAQDQVEDSVTDPQKQKRDLQMRLRVRQIKFEARQLELLAIERERLIDEALREQARKIHNNNKAITMLLIAALH